MSVIQHGQPQELGGASAGLFIGSSEMASRCRVFEWSSTPLGPVAGWSQSLRTTVSTMLASRHPMFLWWGPDLVQIFNDGYLPSFGTTGRDLVALGARGREHWAEIWHLIGPEIESVLVNGEATWHEDHLVPIERNGHIEDVWWTYGYSPVRDDNGAIGGVLVVVQETTSRVLAVAERDVLLAAERTARAETDRLRTEAENARERLADLVRRAPAFIAVLRGPELIFELANDAYYHLIGRRDVIGKPMFDAVPEARGQGFEQRLQDVLETGEPFVGHELPVTLARQPGAPPEIRYVTCVYTRLTEINRARSGVFVHGVDVTELVRARKAIEASRDEAQNRAATLAAIFESIPDAVFVANADGVTSANAPALEQFGFTTPAELHRAIPVLAAEMQTRDPETGRELNPEELPLMRAIGAGVRSARDLLVRHRVSGEDRILRCSAAPVIVDGKVVAGVCVNTDVTEMRRAAAERDRALAAAEAANRNKSEFLAVMSHELRTPLNAIGGYAELIEMGLRGPVTEQQRADLEHIQQSQRHVLGLITQVLSYTRVELGTVRYEFADVSVATALDSAEVLIVPQVRARRINYSLEEFDRALVVRADADKLRQILVNLLTNAIKFTEPGGSITVSCVGVGAEIAITVTDTGIGIAPDKLATIFEPFVQVQQPLTRAREGVGLGLAISRDLARAMGGDLTVASTLGSGSAFTVRLPAVSAIPTR